MIDKESDKYKWALVKKIDPNINPNNLKPKETVFQLSNQKLIMVRHSKIYKNGKYFFGITKDKFNLNPLFILLICESLEKVFIFPHEELVWLNNYLPNEKKDSKKKTNNSEEGGSWKLSIKEDLQGFYLYLHGHTNETKIYISFYLNNFSLLDGLIGAKLFSVTEEINGSDKYYEGATTQITINKYERNPQARQKCLATYGLYCCICNFNFEKVYGEIGKGFMQVHHLIPLSDIKQEYELDPIQDLCPVCPNCHAMIHMRKPPYTAEEIRSFIKASQQL
ncbi:hypothetical protein NIES22_16850 [Calothrix brevissima NIES-22]|nr:hypothetical protein NIES22_16850 [Calothrix brevissima NIES-22]